MVILNRMRLSNDEPGLSVARMNEISSAAHAAKREARGVALMVAGGMLLGTLGVFVEEAGQHPLTAVLFRCAFGLLALLVFGAATGRLRELRLSGRALAAAVAAGVLMVANWALFFIAIGSTSIAVATVVFHVQPLWVMAYGAWRLGETVPRARVVAAVGALCGLALATGLFDGAGLAHPAGYWLGIAACLGGSLSYAGVTLIAAVERRVSSYALATWQCLVGLAFLCWWPAVHGLPAWGAAWAWLAGLGAIHTGLAYVLLYAGMSRLATSRVAVLQFVYPAVAILMDWLVYGRVLGPVQLLGVALMALALWSVRRSAG